MLLLTQGSWDEVRDGLHALQTISLDCSDHKIEALENTNKGYNRTLKYSNRLEPQFLTCVQLHGLLQTT